MKLLLLLHLFLQIHAKVYNRCELARELVSLHEIPRSQVPTWVCIANYESNFNTSAKNPGSGDHGIFQISDLYWCSPGGFACGISCEQLEDDDLEDDVVCARRIYREHKRLSGDGFNAWVVYPIYCKGDEVGRWVKGCFEGENEVVEVSVRIKEDNSSAVAMVSEGNISEISTENNSKLSTGSRSGQTAPSAVTEKISTEKTQVVKSAGESVRPSSRLRTLQVWKSQVQGLKSYKSMKYMFGKVNYSFVRKANGGFSLRRVEPQR